MEHVETSLMRTASRGVDRAPTIAFSDEFHRLVARSKIQSIDIQVATESQVVNALEMVSREMAIAGSDVALAIHRHNPECFRIVWRGSLENSPMMTYLPLNAEGTAALIAGRLDPRAPELRWISRSGEQPDSLYLWLMYVPGKMVAGLRLIAEMEKFGGGSPIFTRPIHRESARILQIAGFVAAKEYFPIASTDLVFTLSKPAAQASRAKGSITVRLVRSFEDMAKIVVVRTATYMCEQMCSYEEEFDGNDFSATHLLGEINGEPAGCVRIRYFGEFAKIERFAVRPEYRRSRIMRELARYALDFCARKGFKKVYGHVRHDLVPAWEKMFGAKPYGSREQFSFSDVTYREMVFDLPVHQQAICLGADPLTIIRPEGDWDRLGPVEKAQFVKSDDRRQKIDELRQFAA